MDNENKKDIHRFSHSRLSTFKTCPRKHYYIYIEQLETPEINIHTTSGKMFHKCVELTLKGQSCQPVYDEWRKLCTTGKLELEPDLLEYIVNKYFQYYAKDYSMEKTILVEHEFRDDFEDEDYLVGAIDQAFTSLQYNYVRDIKTTLNQLKYTHEDVMLNQQLLLYAIYAEEDLKTKIHAIQIDEVRLAKLQPVPYRNNGKPSTDKKLLSLVTYEDYYDALSSMGLEKEKEYQPILDYLQQRGHPLFNRVTVQLLARNVLQTNAEDILETYKVAKQQYKYRSRGPLCKYCAFKELCELDAMNPDIQSRQAIIDKIRTS